jgi:outer membrane protein TolC
MKAGITSVKAALSSLMGGKEFDSAVAVKIMVNGAEEIETNYDISSLKRCQAAEIDIKASTKKREQSKAGYYPRIDFNAYYGQNLGPNDTTNNDPSTGNAIIEKGDWNNQEIWQLGLKLKWNILDFGSTSTINQEAMLSHMNARLKSEGVRIELRKNITTAQSDIMLAAAQYKSASSQFRLLSETEKIEQIRYENDALTLTDLLDTSAEKELAHAQMLNAKYNYQKAKYYLDYLLEKGENR